MSARIDGFSLWEIRWPGGSVLFVGMLDEMAAEINRRHRETGLLHGAREM